MSQLKVCGNSMSKEFHQGKKGSKADLVEWREGFKLEGPICEITTNSVSFI